MPFEIDVLGSYPIIRENWLQLYEKCIAADLHVAETWAHSCSQAVMGRYHKIMEWNNPELMQQPWWWDSAFNCCFFVSFFFLRDNLCSSLPVIRQKAQRSRGQLKWRGKHEDLNLLWTMRICVNHVPNICLCMHIYMIRGDIINIWQWHMDIYN